MVIPIFIVGLISAIITEALKLFPILSETKERKRLVAFVITLVISFVYLATEGEYSGQGILAFCLGTLAASFAVYHSLIQTVVKLGKISVKE